MLPHTVWRETFEGDNFHKLVKTKCATYLKWMLQSKLAQGSILTSSGLEFPCMIINVFRQSEACIAYVWSTTIE